MVSSSVSATARDFTSGFTPTVSYAQLILAACNKDPLPEVINQPLPPRHEAIQIIQHYYDNFFALYPIFQESSFFGSLDAIYSQRGAVASDFDIFTVRMVLGISHAGKLEQRGDHHYMAAVGHVSAALKHAEQVIRPGSIQSIQAMILLHEYSMIDPHHFDSWSLIGAASRAMVDIGLHQDPPRGTSMSRSKLELRRRVFWCVYGFDSSTSLVQTRAFSFSDDSANVALPFNPAYATARQQGQSSNIMLKTIETAPALFKLRRLQSSWYTELFQSGREPWPDPYPTLWKICQGMKEWWDSIPSSTDQHIRSFFENNLLYSYVYILAPSPRVPIIAPFAQSLIYEYCIQYSDKMKIHVDNRAHAAPISFYDAMRAYMTGRQFIEVLWHNQDRLLSGTIPEPPHVPLDSTPPPVMPPTSKDMQINITRSIACIKKFTDCLGLFGVRWGYMSWRDRFQKDSEELLNALNRRSWELQDSTANLSGQSRRPVYRHENSVGSLGSDSLGTPFGSETHHTPFGSDSLNTPSPYGQQHLYTSPSNVQTNLTPTYPPDYYQHTAGYFSQQGQSLQTFEQQQQSALPATVPAQQFAHWSGLNAPASHQAQNGAPGENGVPNMDPFGGI